MGYFIGSKCKWCKQNQVRFGSPYCSKKCQSEAEGNKSSSSGGSEDSGVTGDIVYFLLFGWWIALGKFMFWMMKKSTEMAIRFYKWNPKVAVASAIVFSVLTLINNACEQSKKEEIENNVKMSFVAENSKQSILAKKYAEYYEDFDQASEPNKLAKYLTNLEPIIKEVLSPNEKLVVIVKEVEKSSDNKFVYLKVRIPETEIYLTNKKTIFKDGDFGISEGDARFIEILTLKKDDVLELNFNKSEINFNMIKNGIISKNSETDVYVNFDKIKKLN
ncbi:hypothetical protein EHQ94_11150 [Leptospira meyeri]|uniref:hypothetical protein n=1 Tax=Leptospira meyeri TaxID=29508 RepID=UPI001082C441|nr:hypothetical protein [Leptospira meyeri]TGM66145.1 hypothetical protein EHQ94_11150 [Leptospira meyeri]